MHGRSIPNFKSLGKGVLACQCSRAFHPLVPSKCLPFHVKRGDREPLLEKCLMKVEELMGSIEPNYWISPVMSHGLERTIMEASNHEDGMGERGRSIPHEMSQVLDSLFDRVLMMELLDPHLFIHLHRRVSADYLIHHLNRRDNVPLKEGNA
ncbi:hypothetical protein HHK36_021225 [Tetracentron sinense]|uniref:Uncharacterized protein n=1 Tax=Tetracentron sinense TaxID=13715 RepID=A0A834YPB7_TETSI|nr:hypothetical protein HHK36_021225 [Tetracentron sinense]